MTTLAERLRRHGLTQDDLDEMDDGLCWICGDPESIANRRLAIDHDHVTGSVRGFLCTRCNQVIGRMHDDPALLRRAAIYLETARATFSDACIECEGPLVICAPLGVVESDGRWTEFYYRCDAGHVWTCGYLTAGMASRR